MLTQLQGHQLPAWIEAAATANLPSFQRFARHLKRDLDAVTAGLSQPWNSGVVEGHVNQIKMLKARCSAAPASNSSASAFCSTRDTLAYLWLVDGIASACDPQPSPDRAASPRRAPSLSGAAGRHELGFARHRLRHG
ncbi:transposase [Streptomyces sp. BE308]|nr:transposase [Streptomyces sp. BE308]MEE1792607.1 transposase [Streptomyces sp. BE308]